MVSTAQDPEAQCSGITAQMQDSQAANQRNFTSKSILMKNRPTAEDALAGKNSLYDEVKKLIAVRKEHQALQNTAPMEFVYVKESAYPLVYKRTGKDETI